jgi:hypothetical protein
MPDSNRSGWFSPRGAAFGLAFSAVAGGVLALQARRPAPAVGSWALAPAPQMPVSVVVAEPPPAPPAPAGPPPEALAGLPPGRVPRVLADLPPADLDRAARLVSCLLAWGRPDRADALAARVAREDVKQGLRLLIVELMAAQAGPPRRPPIGVPPAPPVVGGTEPADGVRCSDPAAPPGPGPGDLDVARIREALPLLDGLRDAAMKVEALLALAERTPARSAEVFLDAPAWGEVERFVAGRLSAPPPAPAAVVSYPGQGLLAALIAELSRRDRDLVAAGKTLAERQRALRSEAETLYNALVVREPAEAEVAPAPAPPALPPGVRAFAGLAAPQPPGAAPDSPVSVSSLVEGAIERTQFAQAQVEEQQRAGREALFGWGRNLVLTGIPPIVGALAPALAARLRSGRGRRRADA